MARDVNRYESIVLDKMTDIWREGRTAGMADQKQAVESVLVLLDCIVEWRYQTSEPLESGCGKLVSVNES